MARDTVILVDKQGRTLGTMDKLTVHQKGLLHRAFSIFVFNPQNQLLIHKRATSKYHSGGLWTNTCCSHPRPLETTMEAAHRRLKEEMGFDCELHEAFSFVYRIALDNGLIEHEYDHILTGVHSGKPSPNPEEVADWKFVDLPMLRQDVNSHPENYTYWFKLALEKLEVQQQTKPLAG